jgi:hypothetical protein
VSKAVPRASALPPGLAPLLSLRLIASALGDQLTFAGAESQWHRLELTDPETGQVLEVVWLQRNGDIQNLIVNPVIK